MQVGLDIVTSANCKSQLQFGLDKHCSALVLTSSKYFQSAAARADGMLFPTRIKSCTLFASILTPYTIQKLMLTEQEVNKIFSWQPYRDNWIVDRNQIDDNINAYYGDLITKLAQNILFDTYYSEDGGLGNYLEFICYPKEHDTYKGNAIIVCISLCAPVAAYGQTTFTKMHDYIGWGGLFTADKIGDITDYSLTIIEKVIKALLLQHNLTLLDKEFVSKQLSDEVIEALKGENHNDGIQYLQGIFQKTD